jgi:hypothetical protein
LFPLSFPDAKGVQNKKAFDRDHNRDYTIGIIQATYRSSAVLKALGEVIKTPANDPLPAEFYEEASYNGDCINRPEGANCVCYSDGYIWLLGVTVSNYGDNGSWKGMQIEVAYATKGFTYDHILGTSYVGRRCNDD